MQNITCSYHDHLFWEVNSYEKEINNDGSGIVNGNICGRIDAAVDVLPIFYADLYYLDDYGDYVLADEPLDICTEYSKGLTSWDSDELHIMSNSPEFIEPGESVEINKSYYARSSHFSSEYFLENCIIEPGYLDIYDYSSLEYDIIYSVDYVIDAEKMESVEGENAE